MQIGRSVSDCTIWIALANRSGSSVSGTPMLMSSTSAPPSTWALTSRSMAEKSPARSCSWKIRRPVGLMRSPMMQNRWPWPRTTSLVALRSLVSSGSAVGRHASTLARRFWRRSLAFLTVADASAA